MEKKSDKSKLPLINVHTHIFTEKNIPPLIAKTFIPWPFYYFLHIGFVFRLFKFYKWIKDKLKPLWSFQTAVIAFIKTRWLTRHLGKLISLFLTLNALVILINWSDFSESWTWYQNMLNFLENSVFRYILAYNIPTVFQVLLLVVLFFLYPKVASLLFSLARKLFSQLKYLPTEETLKFIQRYITIAEFAKYKSQKGIFDRLIKMYDPGSKVVVLPMDMEYMEAGRPKQSYREQIQEIFKIKDEKQTNSEHLIPFVFVDPRRIKDEGKSFFNWELEKVEQGFQVRLLDCFLKDCLEGKNGKSAYFKGIKLYPALGYYPFDEALLPLWAYCVQRNLPITTHCIEGTIFYRGDMKKEWMHHPVFTDNEGKPLQTKVQSNYELQLNFTHPLNYLVLLEDHYLAKVVGSAGESVKQLFRYDAQNKSVGLSLNRLKINLAHYGGRKEWKRYIEADRKDLSSELMENPYRGIELFSKQNPSTGTKEFIYSKPAWIWNNDYEWFSIISSLMLQYPNVYADISYVLHNEDVRPLLYQVLHGNEKLAKKILFGTDFFVVRNHKSEKELYAELLESLGEDKMGQISKKNPKEFLGHVEY
nr:amidohydrolase family protein [uncultured Allomuricauda sp.]